MTARLEAQSLSLQRNSTYLLKNISFSLKNGEIFAVTGPSGSGKSTLLHLLSRLQEPTAGEILFSGRPFREIETRSLRRQITLVFQTPVLLGPTVLDDLQLGLEFSPSLPPRIADRDWAKRVLKTAHLSGELLDENPKKLSVGEAQRVALARAMAIEPKVLLLDEPTSALDMASKQAIEESLKELSQRGLSIVLVTHDPRQMQDLTQHGIELNKGEISRSW